MPFSSKAQWRKFGELLEQGKISQETFDEWSHGVDYDSLPERVSPNKQPEAAPAPGGFTRIRARKR
jgi:hypothetical protein